MESEKGLLNSSGIDMFDEEELSSSWPAALSRARRPPTSARAFKSRFPDDSGVVYRFRSGESATTRSACS